MDILTQGLLGSALAQTGATKKETKLATLVGCLSGLLADADVLINSSSDPLLTIEYHRHFSHSIFFIPIGALIAALLMWPFIKNRLEFRRLYIFALLGYSLSGFIDACTSYGTHLFWPLSDERTSFHIISIIDPVFTGVLLTAVIIAFRKQNRKVAVSGLLFCAGYLLLGLFQNQRAESVAMDLAASRHHQVDRLVVKPTLGNLLLWRSVYMSGEKIYVDAIRLGVMDSNKIYKGNSTSLFKPERDASDIQKDSLLYKDIVRFEKFSDGFISLIPGSPETIIDVRYSVLPDSIKSLWGITFDRNSIDKHAKYEFFRDASYPVRIKFIQMLKGQELSVKGSS